MHSTLKSVVDWSRPENGNSEDDHIACSPGILTNFDRIRAAMSAKLNESGWTDDVHHKSKGKFIKNHIHYHPSNPDFCRDGQEHGATFILDTSCRIRSPSREYGFGASPLPRIYTN